MGVYEDMANDAGYFYGTVENRMMADMLEQDFAMQVAYEQYMKEIEEQYWQEQWEEYCDEMDYYDWLLSRRSE